MRNMGNHKRTNVPLLRHSVARRSAALTSRKQVQDAVLELNRDRRGRDRLIAEKAQFIEPSIGIWDNLNRAAERDRRKLIVVEKVDQSRHRLGPFTNEDADRGQLSVNRSPVP